MFTAVEHAINCGRRLQSSQTEYVHIQDTIPFYENILFALALLRSRQKDNIQEGIKIISNLLKFAHENNFPASLHEYPICKNPYLPISLLSIAKTPYGR